MKNKVGKPKKYTTTQLNELLLKYIEEHTNEKITYLALEKATGISRNTWARNMKEEIRKLNEPLPIVSNTGSEVLPLPNIAELVQNNYHNQKKLIDALSQVNRSINNLYEKAKRAYNLEQENSNLIEEIKKLKFEGKQNEEIIKLLKEQVDFYSQQYRNIVATSTYKENGLKNLLEFKRGDSRNTEKITADLIKQFDMFKPK